MSNHDLPRAATRYCRGEDDAQAKIAMALLLTLRGTPFLYYGEEIGMRDISLARRDILDPPGKRYWPIYKGRDGCRAPMQWDDTKNAGFSDATPWLPVNPDYLSRNVASQTADPDSLFNSTRALIALRKSTPALTRGTCTLLPSPRGTLMYLRSVPGQSVLVALNFGGRDSSVQVPPALSADAKVLFSTRGSRGADRSNVALPAHGILLLGSQP
jgi:alpha-glucosidase